MKSIMFLGQLVLAIGSTTAWAQIPSAPVYDHPRYPTDKPPYRKPDSQKTYTPPSGYAHAPYAPYAPRYTNGTAEKRQPKSFIKTSDNAVIPLEKIFAAKANVFVMLAPECPISQQCTKELNALYTEYSAGEIAFYGVMPGNDYSI